MEYLQRLFENDCCDKEDFIFCNEIFMEVLAHSKPTEDKHQWGKPRKDPGAQMHGKSASRTKRRQRAADEEYDELINEVREWAAKQSPEVQELTDQELAGLQARIESEDPDPWAVKLEAAVADDQDYGTQFDDESRY